MPCKNCQILKKVVCLGINGPLNINIIPRRGMWRMLSAVFNRQVLFIYYNIAAILVACHVVVVVPIRYVTMYIYCMHISRCPLLHRMMNYMYMLSCLLKTRQRSY